jgi:hypothetical protein
VLVETLEGLGRGSGAPTGGLAALRAAAQADGGTAPEALLASLAAVLV